MVTTINVIYMMKLEKNYMDKIYNKNAQKELINSNKV